MRRLGRAPALVAGAVMLVASVSGCDLTFRTVRATAVLAPAEEATVSLPFVLRWRAPTRTTHGSRLYFAVFVDRAPIAPGQSLRAVASTQCNAQPDCPDLAYLAQHQVYVTAGEQFRLTAVPPFTASVIQTAGRGEHRVVIVPIDGQGRRVGETAMAVDFEVRGADT